MAITDHLRQASGLENPFNTCTDLGCFTPEARRELEAFVFDFLIRTITETDPDMVRLNRRFYPNLTNWANDAVGRVLLLKVETAVRESSEWPHNEDLNAPDCGAKPDEAANAAETKVEA